ncbi:hypothetical protein CUN67_29635 (plasmid) [Pantoea cypripedii]|uniref:Uncharacterized protein n=1 Tax=Pantoea cypripedii TaxID=55209 RepID=A0A6B9G9A0_PANCY|nr:hypothetical protein CUN67_29635 [Pantoea cypripedii]
MNDNSPTPSTDDWQRPYRKTSQVYRKGDALIQDIVAGRLTQCLDEDGRVTDIRPGKLKLL